MGQLLERQARRMAEARQNSFADNVIAHLVEQEEERGVVCDFCNGQRPTARYECNTYLMPKRRAIDGIELLPVTWVEGRWYACATCEDLIDRDQYSMLNARCVLHNLQRAPAKARRKYAGKRKKQLLTREVRQLHDLFRLNRGRKVSVIER